ncbi:MAG: NUDIX domain-containing protein [Clostridia bacterium]|nr:NUDIX domain-containing protein [Clostridia bacterium]
MEPERYKVRCAVHLFLVKDGKFLVEKRCNREWCNGQYDVIAGHIPGGKDVVTSMIEIAKKEVNIDIKKEDLEFIQVMHDNSSNQEYISYFFKATKYSGEIKNNEPNICEKLEWVDMKYPVDNLIDYINEALKNYIEKPDQKMTLYGWNKK